MTLMADPAQAQNDPPERVPTRQRVIAEAMRLFGEQGYAATTVAQIESAAGLRAGSGGMYRHFSSKQELLEHGVREQLASQRALVEFLADPGGLSRLPLRGRLAAMAVAGLERLDRERDLNRIILRDLRFFPELLELVRADEMNRIQGVLSGWLEKQVEPTPPGVDWDALAAVLMGGISHYWVLRDSMVTHPSGVEERRYIDAMVDLVTMRLEAR